MADRSPAADRTVSAGVHPRVPLRTCLGCRTSVAATDLLRVVAGPTVDGPAGGTAVLPDPRHRLPGRGAWLHRDERCLATAERRRAFARALRVPGPVDLAAVRAAVTDGPGDAPPAGRHSTIQESTGNGHSMKRQR